MTDHTTIDEDLQSHATTCDLMCQAAKKRGDPVAAKRWDTRAKFAKGYQYAEFIDNDEMAEASQFDDLKYKAEKHHRRVSLDPATHKEIVDAMDRL